MLDRDVKIVKITNLGVIIEDRDFYQCFIDREHIPELIAKLSVAVSIPESSLPLGGDMHPSCVVNEYKESN